MDKNFITDVRELHPQQVIVNIALKVFECHYNLLRIYYETRNIHFLVTTSIVFGTY